MNLLSACHGNPPLQAFHAARPPRIPGARSLPAAACLLVAAGSALLAHPLPAAGQAPSTPPRVLSLPASPRAMALGGAYMMNANHADAIFHHPALLAGATGFGLDVQRWNGAGASGAASAATGWLGGGIGIGLQVLTAGLPERLETGAGGVPHPGTDRQDDLVTHGPVPLSEQVATLGYARSLFGVRFGVTGKLVELRLGGARSSTLLADVGAARTLGPVTVGLTVKDLGNDPFQSDGDFTPARVVLGVGSYGKQVGPLDIGFTGAVSRSSAETRIGGGLEFGYWPISGRTFVGRVGVQTTPEGSEADPVTFGFAFWGDRVVVEWAYQGFGGLDAATHRFGVRWR